MCVLAWWEGKNQVLIWTSAKWHKTDPVKSIPKSQQKPLAQSQGQG
jgi:hypothetical protein